MSDKCRGIHLNLKSGCSRLAAESDCIFAFLSRPKKVTISIKLIKFFSPFFQAIIGYKSTGRHTTCGSRMRHLPE